MAIDNLDRTLLRLLQEDARQSYRTLAKAAGSTVPTVSARIKRMEDLGIIQGYSVVLDEARFAGDLTGAVQVTCHECGRATGDPVEATLGGRKHAFCCTSCKGLFVARFDRMRQAS